MNKQDVERVLEKAREFWQHQLHEHLSLVDIYALAEQIWQEIQYDTTWDDNIKELVFRKSDMLYLERHKDLHLEYEDGTYIYFYFVDDTEITSITESGQIYLWGEAAGEHR